MAEEKIVRSGCEGLVKEEMRDEASDEEGVREIAQVSQVGKKRKIDEEDISNPSSPKQNDQVGSTKIEIEEVREENDRLKTLMGQIMKDYQSLQLHIFNIAHQEQQPKKSIDTTPTNDLVEESELVSLRLGRSSSAHKTEDKDGNLSKSEVEEDLQEGLALGLDSKFQGSKSYQMVHASNTSPESSTDKPKIEEVGEQAQRQMETMRSQNDEPSHNIIVKKARVSVRARCDTPTMNDGCQWRKYGQKTAKGNPCPRAYYRCTVAPACPVRKQVQRSVEDMSILITTYEGTHNHPLPISASAMASTTSAAASMLTSGSSSSSRSAMGASPTTNATSELQRLLNFSLPHNSSIPSQIYIPNSSYISSTPSHPTITLDLTAPSSSSLPSNFPTKPRYSPPTFNFSTMESNTIPTSWNTAYSTSYGPQHINKIPIGSSYLARQPNAQHYIPYMQKNNPPITDETIAAATKAITNDANFRSALTAAITSIVGNGGGNQNVRHNDIQNNMKWAEPLVGLNISSSNPPQGNLGFLPTSLAFSSSSSEVENKDKMN